MSKQRVKITLQQEGQPPIELETEAFCLVIFPDDSEKETTPPKVFNWPAGEGWPWWNAIEAISNLMSQPEQPNITRSIGLALDATIKRGYEMIKAANEELHKHGPQG